MTKKSKEDTTERKKRIKILADEAELARLSAEILPAAHKPSSVPASALSTNDITKEPDTPGDVF